MYTIIYELLDLSGITLKKVDPLNLQDLSVLKRLENFNYAFEIYLSDESLFKILESLSVEDHKTLKQISFKYQKVEQEYALESEHPILK